MIGQNNEDLQKASCSAHAHHMNGVRKSPNAPTSEQTRKSAHHLCIIQDHNKPILENANLFKIDDIIQRLERCLVSNKPLDPPKPSIGSPSLKDSRESRDTACLLANNVEVMPFKDETQLARIMSLMAANLSEPYSIYTYRYFIHNWPNICFVAEDCSTKEVVGAIVCKLDTNQNAQRFGYIAMLAVAENFRRQKLGSRLVTAAVNAMQQEGCIEVILETEATNKKSLCLYEQLGFIREKKLHKYYLNGVDAYRLKLVLFRSASSSHDIVQGV